MKIMFIGILTEDVLEYTRNEKLISTLVGITDAAEEVGRICGSSSCVPGSTGLSPGFLLVSS